MTSAMNARLRDLSHLLFDVARSLEKLVDKVRYQDFIVGGGREDRACGTCD